MLHLDNVKLHVKARSQKEAAGLDRVPRMSAQAHAREFKSSLSLVTSLTRH